MAERLVYPVTTGRSGTVFLAELLRCNLPADDARVHHERTGFPNFGVHTPDASHFTTFNTVGNAPNVQAFFRSKLGRDVADERACHVEVSHFLCKAGLVENLPALSDEVEVHLVGLARDPFRIAWSFVNRFDFFNTGFTWLFSLDPRYPNVILSSEPFRAHGMIGSAIWYVAEMFARMAYYRLLVREEMPGVRWHDVTLESLVEPSGAAALLGGLGFPRSEVAMPPKRNETRTEFFGEPDRRRARELFEQLWDDPAAAGESYYRRGTRLAADYPLDGGGAATAGVS